MRIFVDLDGVVADLASDWCFFYNLYARANPHLKLQTSVAPDDFIRDWDVEKNYPHAFHILDRPGLFRNLPVVRGANRGINELQRRGHDVLFLTSGLATTAASEKQAWVKEHFGSVMHKNTIICTRKDVVGRSGDILVDDHVENVRSWQGLDAILFDAPHNRSFQQWVLRARDWTEVVECIDKIDKAST